MEEVKVTDWSQKWKLLVYAIAIIGFSAYIALRVDPWMNEVVSLLKNAQ